jgi:hypothetical protein
MATLSLQDADWSLDGTARGWSIRATPATLCRVTLGAFVLTLVTNTSADPDLWGHLRFGLDMLASKSIPCADLYSFTADRAWINHEWVAELLIGIGYTGLAALDTGQSVILGRRPGPTAVHAVTPPSGPDTFPWP